MKIRKIALENLNSLVGEHVLDLAAEPIASAGIFAITGPTGAGKSTLLDAVTLALYGRAARYDRPNPEDMMSRHQGKCRAEVEFEVKGEIYRAEWTRHRAREKADGKMQPAKRFIYDGTGQVLTQSLTEADAKVEAICGLSYERFMRSVLLAQGEFARFLKAKEDERAGLLESLTGTSIFSELSEIIFASTSQKARELEEQERVLGTVQPMEDEVRAGKVARQQAIEKELKGLRERQKELAGALLKADEFSKVAASLEKAKAELARVVAERRQNDEGLRRLAKHRELERLFPQLTKVEDGRMAVGTLERQLDDGRSGRDRARKQLEVGVASAGQLLRLWIGEREKLLAGLRREAVQATEKRGVVEAWLQAHRSDVSLRDQQAVLFERIEALRIERGHWKQAHGKLIELKGDHEVAAKRAGDLEKQSGSLQAEQTRLQGLGIKLEKKLAEIGGGLDAAGRRVAIERLGNLVAVQEKITSGESQVRSDQANLLDRKKHLDAVAARRHSAAELLEAHQAHLQTEILRAGLADHRKQLKEGDACPLCGATEHPLAADLDGGSKISELEKKVANAKADLVSIEVEEKKGARVVSEIEARISATGEEQARLRGELERGAVSLGLGEAPGERADLVRLLEEWKKDLASYETVAGELEKTKAELESMGHALQRLQIEQTSCREILAKLATQQSAEQAALARALRAGEQAQDELEESLRPFNELVPAAGKEHALRQSLVDRAKVYDDQQAELAAALESTRSSESRQQEVVSELEVLRGRAESLEVVDGVAPETWEAGSVAEMDKKLAELDTAMTSANAAVSEREKQLGAAREELEQRSIKLAAELEGTTARDEEELRGMRLGEDDLAKLAGLEKRLADEEARAKGRIETLAESVERLSGEGLPAGEALDQLREEGQKVDAQTETLADEVAAIRAELKADDKNRETLKAAAAALGESRERLKLWQRLNGLIGSSDGKKFRRFAQGLSLDILLRHANQHLERLNGRYQLARREGEELGLEIVDLFQASVTRPMSSLSGGESFLTSLALALGLSDLAGRNVQIDSLFIDEGFGTLDGDTLDEAISALEALRLREKTVGVISHVELLKERISTQVVVGLGPGGRGKVEVVG